VRTTEAVDRDNQNPSLAQQMRERRSEMMITELEGVALRLFEERGFADVTVQDIAAEAQISVRTFYRYFPAKDDVLLLRIERRGDALREALARADPGEPPLRALRMAVCDVAAKEDPARVRQWVSVVSAESSVLRAVIGGIYLKIHEVFADFFGARFGLPSGALIPRMLAAAAGGVLEAAHTQWFFQGGDLVSTLSDALEVLERGIGSDPRGWTLDRPAAPSGDRPGRRRTRQAGAAR
jgi:TetR/AcrR family transcriptional regulator, regulator of mycofactocin system